MKRIHLITVFILSLFAGAETARTTPWEAQGLVLEQSSYLDLDGSGTHVETDLDVLGALAGQPGFTLSLWMYPRSLDRRQHVLSQSSHFRVDYREDRGGRLEIRVSIEGGSALLLRAPADTLHKNGWNHVLVSSRAPGESILYINGEPVDRTELDVGYRESETSDRLALGAHSSRIRYFDGRMRDVRLYVGRALDTREVERLARGGTLSSDALWAHWRLNEGGGTRAYDDSGNDREGTIHGGQWGDRVMARDAEGRPSVAGLSMLLFDMDDWTRFQAAAEALQELGWTPDEDERGIRHAIARGQWAFVRRMGVHAAEPVTEALRRGDEFTRIEAARHLGALGGTQAEHALLEATRDESARVRTAAGEALAGLSPNPAIRSPHYCFDRITGFSVCSALSESRLSCTSRPNNF